MDRFLEKVASKASTSAAQAGLIPKSNDPAVWKHGREFHNAPCDAVPTLHQIYSYRKQRGVNLGSWFTLETWLVPSLFQDVKGAKSEYDLCQQLDTKVVKERLERHWNTFVDKGDWQWMQAHGINTIRLPISYYHFLSGHPNASVRHLMKETDYARFASIYEKGYDCIMQAIRTAAEHGVGVLVDLHSAPGGQNSEGHCGLSSGKAGFFSESKHRKTTIAILQAIADTVVQYDNVVGLELINEPHNHDKLPGWYDDAIHAICSRYGTRLPLYLGDCWSTEQYAHLLARNKHKGFLVMDHHLYRCFTQNDHVKSATEHANELHPSQNGPSYARLSNAASTLQGNLVVGEWSGALHHTSIKSEPNAQIAMQKWAGAQLEAFHAQCGGFYFWTLKKEGPPDAGWCLYSAIEQGVLPKGLGGPSAGKGGAKSKEELERIGNDCGNRAYDGHTMYWNAHGNGMPTNHDKFLTGFGQMWQDCLVFYERDQSEIGFAGRWIEQRAKAYTQQHYANRPEGEWEFVHGAQQALQSFTHAIRQQ